MLTNDEELDPLVFDNLEVNRRAEVAHVDPSSSPLYRILRPRRSTGLDGGRELHSTDSGVPSEKGLLCFSGFYQVRGLQSPEIFRLFSHIHGNS